MKQQRNTRQRQLVLDVVRGRRDHPTAEQIYQSVREQDAHVSRGTVYRNLNLLCDNREIYRVVMSNSDRFDLRTDPHYHIHCLVCDSVVDVPYTYDRAYDETLEQETGYRVLCHHMVVEGVCPDCQGSETGSVQEWLFSLKATGSRSTFRDPLFRWTPLFGIQASSLAVHKKEPPQGAAQTGGILESFLDYGSTNWLYCKWELLSNAVPFRRFKIFCEFYTFASGKAQGNVI